MTVSIEKKKITRLLMRRVAEVITEDSLRQKLEFGRPLRIKFGADPTAPDLHLGHVVPLKKLREFQELGHTIVLIIGDYTAMIGDPSGKSKTRPMLSEEEVRQNAETYLAQVGKILDREQLEVHRNSEWFAGMSFAEVVQLAARFTVARLIERDDFEQRLKGGVDVHMHELLYPMMQAYDSIMVDADVEIGGTDQRFNILAGRELQRKLGKPEQDVMFLGPILVGTDGKQKMSKSLGNYIGITDEPADMFGKVMSIPDEAMWDYWTLVTDESETEIKKMRTTCQQSKMNPRDAKAKLARVIVTEFHSDQAASEAEQAFDRLFRQGQQPEDIQSFETAEEQLSLIDVLVNAGLATSKTDARRVIEQGGVKVDDQIVTDIATLITPTSEGIIIQKGKRHFTKVTKK
ncbi:tyrosine--tRNA ligase [Patescibacteria group bacterium]|nr:tyrosine--tRNA ligase [Patescibacteria group bacterium]